MTGGEYKAAREEADQANKRLHGANSLWDDLELHDIHPMKFGEAPADPNNKFALEKKDHVPFNVWWLRLQRRVEGGDGND